jgi:hypothetical protein
MMSALALRPARGRSEPSAKSDGDADGSGGPATNGENASHPMKNREKMCVRVYSIYAYIIEILILI